MTYDDYPPGLLLLELLGFKQRQDLIDKERRQNATDMNFQLAMDRQQSLLNEQKEEFASALAVIARNN